MSLLSRWFYLALTATRSVAEMGGVKKIDSETGSED